MKHLRYHIYIYGKAMVSEILDTMASFNSKDGFKMNGKEGFDLGVTQIPEILRDNTDRNRTSPFAFTVIDLNSEL